MRSCGLNILSSFKIIANEDFFFARIFLNKDHILLAKQAGFQLFHNNFFLREQANVFVSSNRATAL